MKLSELIQLSNEEQMEKYISTKPTKKQVHGISIQLKDTMEESLMEAREPHI